MLLPYVLCGLLLQQVLANRLQHWWHQFGSKLQQLEGFDFVQDIKIGQLGAARDLK